MNDETQPLTSRRTCLATLAAFVPMATGRDRMWAAVAPVGARPDPVGNPRFLRAKGSAALGFVSPANHAVEASPAAAKPRLASKAYPFAELKEKKSGGNSSWAILNGQTWAGCPIEVHETRLAPGAMPHPPHHHAHEEMFLVREGEVEVTISGHATRLGPGSAAFVASNDQHGIQNVGDGSALYFVVAIGNQ
jgi:mannose-6-phosphate isomerase-like protein (cupin superfamily)